MYSLDINEKEIENGRIHLGTVTVEMGKIFLFGSRQRLHEMVSFIPGLGNGSYDVYGEVKPIAGHGFRITKVEIECISPEERCHLEKVHSDISREVAYEHHRVSTANTLASVHEGTNTPVT